MKFFFSYLIHTIELTYTTMSATAVAAAATTTAISGTISTAPVPAPANDYILLLSIYFYETRKNIIFIREFTGIYVKDGINQCIVEFNVLDNMLIIMPYRDKDLVEHYYIIDNFRDRLKNSNPLNFHVKHNTKIIIYETLESPFVGRQYITDYKLVEMLKMQIQFAYSMMTPFGTRYLLHPRKNEMKKIKNYLKIYLHNIMLERMNMISSKIVIEVD